MEVVVIGTDSVSTLLEILGRWLKAGSYLGMSGMSFQPFLRFWQDNDILTRRIVILEFQPFLRFWPPMLRVFQYTFTPLFQPFLRFWVFAVH